MYRSFTILLALGPASAASPAKWTAHEKFFLCPTRRNACHATLDNARPPPCPVSVRVRVCICVLRVLFLGPVGCQHHDRSGAVRRQLHGRVVDGHVPSNRGVRHRLRPPSRYVNFFFFFFIGLIKHFLGNPGQTCRRESSSFFLGGGGG